MVMCFNKAVILKQDYFIYISRVSCQKGLTRYDYAWQIGPFWQDTLDLRFLCRRWRLLTA